MGTPVPTQGSNFLPTLRPSEKVGATFTGKLVKKVKDVQFGDKKCPVYEFEVIDGDMSIQRKNEQKEWVDVDVDPGEHVEVLAGSRLAYAFGQLTPGVIVTITYLGEGLKPKKGGNKPKEYRVEIGG